MFTRNHKVFVRLYLPLLASVAALLLAGCGEPAGVASVAAPVTITAERPVLWSACQAELRRRGFRLDQVNARRGIIDTYPRTSSQWFEPWASDLATSHDRAEASLHSIRRQVYLRMVPAGEEAFQVACRVQVQRLERRREEVVGQITAADVIGVEARNLQGGSTDGTDTMVWAPIAEDPALAADILQAIQAAL